MQSITQLRPRSTLQHRTSICNTTFSINISSLFSQDQHQTSIFLISEIKYHSIFIVTPRVMATKESKAKAKLGEKIKCTYANCYQRFDTAKEMKRHKKYGDEHDYCHLCDQDFEDWDEWAAHNAQWSGKDIFGKTAKQYACEKAEGTFSQNRSEKIREIGPKGEKYGSLKFHNYGCKFCGEQFKTEGARANHYNAVRNPSPSPSLHEH